MKLQQNKTELYQEISLYSISGDALTSEDFDSFNFILYDMECVVGDVEQQKRPD